mmetsp:Transcript_9500/g.17873  ORF Transcript_9500/g.17873 Transcript_9500/m.17873 type:complete len:125 (-) Transcript_9500:342-716(-)
MKKAFKSKSPYECTKRFVAYMEDDSTIYQKLRKNVPIPRSETGQYLCRFCSSTYKARKPFEAHEEFCKLSIETRKAHRIRFKYFKCYGKNCREGQSHQCILKDISGEEQYKWLLSTSDFLKVSQ